MARTLGAGVIGCGSISQTYLRLAPLFRGFEMRACADIDMQAARKRAAEFGLRAETVDGLLAADDVDIVVNLTVPNAHYEVSKDIIEAGKHVYSEKPFVLTTADGRDLVRRAESRGVRIGSAPDTILGGAHQLARRLIDRGSVGAIAGGTCHIMSRGMEHWHPNPDFFFAPGAGPMLDLGPYYVANLVQLLGPVCRVAAIASTPSPKRTITSKPRYGETIEVTTPTTIHAVFEFVGGAVVTLATSWDVWKHCHQPMELYGETGSIFVPDPNFFGGEVIVTKGEKPKTPRAWDHPLGVDNQKHEGGMVANYRTAGLADMAQAIIAGRPHRCSADFALHVVEVMTAALKSGETGEFVRLTTTCERPAALGVADAKRLLAKD